MGRKGSGVEVRGSSIRIAFVLVAGEPPVRRTLVANGRPIAPTPANIRYAERIAAEIKDKIRLGAFRVSDYFEGEAGPSMLLADLLDRWLKAQRVADSTKKGYESAIRFWKAANVTRAGASAMRLGDIPINEVVLSDLNTILAAHPALSGKTINNYVSVLRESLQLAVDDKLLDENPAAKVKRAKWQKPPPDPFSLDEALAIVADMQKHYPGHVANYVAFDFFTGMRTSESVGLRWGSIDWRRRTALVHEAVVRGARKANTKTDRSRTVLLVNEALTALKAQKALTFLAGDAVFHDPRTGEAWSDERAFRRSYWTPTLKRLGIRYRRPYNTRHTYATVMLMSGARPMWVAEQMGHSLKVLLDRYAKWIPGGHDAAELARVQQFINGPQAQEGMGT